MLSLIQNGQKLYYLLWEPSESAPIVKKIGSLDFPDINFSNKKYITELINNIVISTGVNNLSFTISNDNVFYSDIEVPKDVDFNEIFKWNQNQFLEHISDKYSVYHYPVHYSSTSFFNIHIKKEILSVLKESFKEINVNVHSISVGIFSAEIACRKWYNADSLKKYLVVRLSAKGKSYLLEVVDNKLNRFMIFKKIKNSIQPLQVVGNHNDFNQIFDLINSVAYNKKLPNHTFSKIFLYGDSLKFINKLLPDDVNSICKLDPFEILSVESSLKFDSEKSMQLVEIGNSFRGVDV